MLEKYMLLQEKKYYDIIVNLGLSKSPKSIEYGVNYLFQGIDFKDKRVLDIGGGTGKYSFYAFVKGAKEIINLEPFSEGSNKKMLE